LSWKNNASNQTGFQIERSSDGIDFTVLAKASKSSTTYSDGTVIPGSGYYYRIAAFNTGGNSRYATLASAVGTPPAAPSSLTSSAANTSQINLAWHDNSSNEDGFVLSRSTDNVTFTPVVTTGSNVTSYGDTGLKAGTKYYYRVVSFNSFGSSGPASAVITTPKR